MDSEHTQSARPSAALLLLAERNLFYVKGGECCETEMAQPSVVVEREYLIESAKYILYQS